MLDTIKLYDIYNQNKSPEISSVGGKGQSLIYMATHGLPVPPGFVLVTEFFEPWISQIKKTTQWKEFIQSDIKEMNEKAQNLNLLCKDFELTSEQKKLLNDKLTQYKEFNLFAVRSSSPEEDLEGASFAGNYETILGVSKNNIEDAIKQVFTSCLNPRVFIYKKENNFDVSNIRIAVVVQAQIPSKIAGVGFSVNPLTNDYDEAVFNASWGLGESVVSGSVIPDQFIVNKISLEILETTLGTKEVALWLRDDGGVEEDKNYKHNEKTLSDDQLMELTRQLCHIEQLYKKPMDIEWAFTEDNKLYLLQARPITTVIPLPESMKTQPDEQKILYLDLTLIEQGIMEPLTVMGTNVLHNMLRYLSIEAVGNESISQIKDGICFATGGRMYVNISNNMLYSGSAMLADSYRGLDTVTAEILEQADYKTYKPAHVPKNLKGLEVNSVIHLLNPIARVIDSAVHPEHLEKLYEAEINDYLQNIDKNDSLPVKEYCDDLLSKNIHLMMHTIVPTLIAGESSKAIIQQICSKELNKEEGLKHYLKKYVQVLLHALTPSMINRDTARNALNETLANVDEKTDRIKYYLERIDRSLPHNVTIEMGLELYRLSKFLDKNFITSYEKFESEFKNNNLSDEFKTHWDNFMKLYGFRGPREVDIASKRYKECPELLLKQIYNLLQSTTDEDNPETILISSQEQRKEAYDALMNIIKDHSKLRMHELQWVYRILEKFGGYRENCKYYLIMCISKMRNRVLEEAQKLVDAGRLDNLDQFFDLTFEDLAKGISNKDIDLRAVAKENTRFLNSLKHIHNFPKLIDSRGRILKLPLPPLKEGEYAGQPVSPGVVSGRVKVLNYFDEKPLLPAEILVARVTDPGWTPLFINASAVILEVGGMLQHGSLIAREYGKPCIVGINNATEIFKDGDFIEVDGTLGIIKTKLNDQ